MWFLVLYIEDDTEGNVLLVYFKGITKICMEGLEKKSRNEINKDSLSAGIRVLHPQIVKP
jgi:hypothetical protein